MKKPKGGKSAIYLAGAGRGIIPTRHEPLRPFYLRNTPQATHITSLPLEFHTETAVPSATQEIVAPTRSFVPLERGILSHAKKHTLETIPKNLKTRLRGAPGHIRARPNTWEGSWRV